MPPALAWSYLRPGHEPRIALMTSGTVGRLKKRTGAVREKGEVARNMIVMAMCSGLHAVHRSSWYDRKVPPGSRFLKVKLTSINFN